MIYSANIIQDAKLLIISDKHRGEFDFSPWGFMGIERTGNSADIISFVGEPDQKGYRLKKYKNTFQSKDDKQLRQIKIWSLAEQLAYFIKDEDYINLFGELNLHPKVMCFDIEVRTKKGQPPNADIHPICMIGLHIYDKSRNMDKVIIIDEESEKLTIERFLRAIIKFDPDILVGYWSIQFDAPFILRRMEILGIPFPPELHRTKIENIGTKYLPVDHPLRIDRIRKSLQRKGMTDPTETYVKSVIADQEKEIRAKDQWKEPEISFGLGRVHYDLYISVKLDAQAITRIKNRKLKTVAEYYGSKNIFDIPDEDKMDMDTMYKTRREEMRRYLTSDLHQTRFVFDVYYGLYASQAQMIGTSFDSIINSKGRAPFSKMFMGRSFIREGFYPYKQNIVRYETMFKTLTDEGKFKGAYVDIKKFGRFEKTAKVDVGSMYPSIIISFNISPETVKYIGTDPLTVQQEHNFENTIDKMVIRNSYYPIILKERTKEYMIISIPEDKAGKYINFRIDTSAPGIIPKTIGNLLDERKKIRKQEMAKLEKDVPEEEYKQLREWKILDSLQNNIKIASNSVYGILGNPHFEVGDLPCAMLVTAFGRELSHYMTTYLGDQAIEIDTDGIYISGTIDIDKLNSSITKVLTEKYKSFVIKQRMALELELKDVPSLFIAMKTYALKKKEKIEMKGSALRGSAKSKFYEAALAEIVTHVLDWKRPEEIRELADTLIYSDKWKDEDFKVSLAVTKGEEEYSYDPGINTTMETIYDTEDSIGIEDAFKRIDAMVKKSLYSAAERLGTGEIVSLTPVKDAKFLPGEVSPLAEWNKESKKIMGPLRKKEKTVSEEAVSQLLVLADHVVGKVGIPSLEKKMPMAIRVLTTAKKEGISAMKGENIEYYYSLGDSPIRLFTKENLSRYPINKQWYQEKLDGTVSKVLKYISQQEITSFF
jgi:DNA polymerase elongation subunit (family B)